MLHNIVRTVLAYDYYVQVMHGHIPQHDILHNMYSEYILRMRSVCLHYINGSICMYRLQMCIVCTNVHCMHKCALYVQMCIVCTNAHCMHKCALYAQPFPPPVT